MRLIFLLMFLSGCGKWEQVQQYLFGYERVCVQGVSYLKFSSGVTVQYLRDGSVAKCLTPKEKKNNEALQKELNHSETSE